VTALAVYTDLSTIVARLSPSTDLIFLFSVTSIKVTGLIFSTYSNKNVNYYYARDCKEGDNKRCFCPSARPSVRPSVCLSVRGVYTANNSRTQRPSVPKFGMKVAHLRCDSHTSFKVKRSKVRVRGGRGHTVSAEPGGHTVC